MESEIIKLIQREEKKMEKSKDLWRKLHEEARYRPKYPSEVVVQYVFRNFKRDGQTKVLDLGCGAGRHVVFMAQENIVPFGMDFSKEGIRHTRERLAQAGYPQYQENCVWGGVTKIPFEDGFFDGLVCYGVLYYLNYSGIKETVAEIKRVLKPGGKAFIYVRSIEDYRYDESKQIPGEEHTIIIEEENKNHCASSENGMLMHFFTEEELRELFKEFHKVEIDYLKETFEDQAFSDFNYVAKIEK
jgi:cyclopropane fatty-acyl-phospholipid synthase-like methyltransferase